MGTAINTNTALFGEQTLPMRREAPQLLNHRCRGDCEAQAAFSLGRRGLTHVGRRWGDILGRLNLTVLGTVWAHLPCVDEPVYKAYVAYPSESMCYIFLYPIE